MTVNDFHVKFEVFQECVKEWIDELNNDLHAMETMNQENDYFRPKSEQEYFEERMKQKKVIRFPGNGKRKSLPVNPDRKG